MSNNLSSSSKVMPVRVPLQLYMDILETATQNKMTITDYILIIILNYRKSTGQQQLNFSTGGTLGNKSVQDVALLKTITELMPSMLSSVENIKNCCAERDLLNDWKTLKNNLKHIEELL